MKPTKFSLPSPLTALTMMIIALLVYAFFSKITLRFYASSLFLFYHLIGRMWIAVICIGILQIILMIPFRIINLKISANINEFKERTQKLKNQSEQAFYVKQHMRSGDRSILFYTIDFFVQSTSYLSIGRLFLTDFYQTRLDPGLLYSLVPYPKYPIQGIYFKIPYPYLTSTTDLGMKAVLIAWIILIVIQFALHTIKFIRQRNSQALKQVMENSKQLTSLAKYMSRNLVVFLLLSWFILRNFPTGWRINIFSGNISIPNRRFNAITAIVTFATIVWFGINKIKRKTSLARAKKVDPEIINETQKQMFKENFRNATMLGLAAYFITNHIPSAFELSIFTFELIALLSPFTLDRVITRNT